MAASEPPRIARRVFLELVATSGATAYVLPACSSSSSVVPPPPSSSFFSIAERAALGALADFVLPPDDTPGGAALGAVPYVESLLTAFDSDPPKIHAGGPYSGRQPFPTADGTASTKFPDNEFLNFLPLSRVATVAWKLRLYGSSGVPGGGPNDAISGPIKGLRDIIKGGLADAMKASSTPLATLDSAALTAIWNGLPVDFTTAFPELVVEGALAAPEYGGNTNLLGWQLVHVDGDVQPLGYSVFDTKTGAYKERLPVSTAGAAHDPDPLDGPTKATLAMLTQILGGRVA